MTDPLTYLKMLEPAVRPVAGQTQQAASVTSFEHQSFDQMLATAGQAAQRQGAAIQPLSAIDSAVDPAGSAVAEVAGFKASGIDAVGVDASAQAPELLPLPGGFTAVLSDAQSPLAAAPSQADRQLSRQPDRQLGSQPGGQSSSQEQSHPLSGLLGPAMVPNASLREMLAQHQEVDGKVPDA